MFFICYLYKTIFMTLFSTLWWLTWRYREHKLTCKFVLLSMCVFNALTEHFAKKSGRKFYFSVNDVNPINVH